MGCTHTVEPRQRGPPRYCLPPSTLASRVASEGQQKNFAPWLVRGRPSSHGGLLPKQRGSADGGHEGGFYGLQYFGRGGGELSVALLIRLPVLLSCHPIGADWVKLAKWSFPADVLLVHSQVSVKRVVIKLLEPQRDNVSNTICQYVNDHDFLCTVVGSRCDNYFQR